jgi:hypothetical protein
VVGIPFDFAQGRLSTAVVRFASRSTILAQDDMGFRMTWF